MAAPADGQEGAERVELRFPVAPREQSVVAALLELLVVVLVVPELTRVACHVLRESHASGVTSDFGPITVPRGASGRCSTSPCSPATTLTQSMPVSRSRTQKPGQPSTAAKVGSSLRFRS